MDFYRAATKKEKKMSRPMAKILLVFGILLVLGILSGGIYLVKYSDFLKTKNVEVVGLAGGFSADDLVANLKDFLVKNSKISSFLGGDNILIWHGGAEEFLKEHPQLEKLAVQADYFSKKVVVNAKEREKFGVWCLKKAEGEEILSGNCFWFDKNGVAFAEAPTIETEIIKQVEDYSGRNLRAGDEVLPDNLIANLAAVFEILGAANLNTNKIHLADLSLQEVSTESSDSNPKAYFSLRFNPEFALSAIDSLKKSGDWGRLSYVDFRVENRVYYKFK